MWNPCKGACQIEDSRGHLPTPSKRVNEEDVIGKWQKGIIHDVWILEIYSAMFNVIARVDQ